MFDYDVFFFCIKNVNVVNLCKNQVEQHCEKLY